VVSFTKHPSMLTACRMFSSSPDRQSKFS